MSTIIIQMSDNGYFIVESNIGEERAKYVFDSVEGLALWLESKFTLIKRNAVDIK